MEVEDKSLIKAIAHFCSRPFGFTSDSSQILTIDLLIREPICLLLCTYTAFLLSILYLFFEAFPLVFMDNHGFSLQFVGLSFTGLGIGEVGGTIISGPIVDALTNWFLRGKNQRGGTTQTGISTYSGNDGCDTRSGGPVLVCIHWIFIDALDCSDPSRYPVWMGIRLGYALSYLWR